MKDDLAVFKDDHRGLQKLLEDERQKVRKYLTLSTFVTPLLVGSQCRSVGHQLFGKTGTPSKIIRKGGNDPPPSGRFR